MERLDVRPGLCARPVAVALFVLVALATRLGGGDGSRPAAAPSAPSLEVVVTERGGAPLEGALVTAFPEASAPRAALLPREARSVFTGRDGRARLDRLPPGPWRVRVHARSLVTRTLRRVSAGPLAVTLERGGVVTGTVVSSAGRPIDGARVVLAGDGPLPSGFSEDATRNVAVSDARGAFRLEGIGPSPETLSVRATGHAVAERPGVNAGERVEFVLFPGATLQGTVRDDAGRLVEGALVIAAADRPWGEEPPSARTDRQGRFEMAGVTPGEYALEAREGGRAPGFGRVVVAPEAEATASLVVSGGGFVTGRLVDDRGRPLRGRARVDAVDDLALPPSMSDRLAAEARDDGTFALGPLPVGELALGLAAEGRAARRLSAVVGAPGRTVDLGDVVLDTGLAITGRVLDGEDRPVPGARITARSETPGEPIPVEAETGDDGRFDMGGLEPGRYRITVAAAGHASTMARAEAGAEPLEVVLEPAGAIGGRVVDGRGRPVREASATATPRGRPALDASPHRVEADPADGSFRFDDLAAGVYDVEARASGHGTAVRPNVRVGAGRTVALGELVLAKGGVVRGSVVDADGRGIASAAVYAEADPGQLTDDLAATTDAAGAFEIPGVPEGRVLLRASHASFAPAVVPEVLVDLTREPEPVRIALSRGARVEGRVRHRDGRPFTIGRVIVQGSAPAAVHSWPEPLPLDESGGFVAEHVPPGPADVHVLVFTPRPTPFEAGSVTTLNPIAMRPVDLREGETATVDVALRDVVVSGRVTRGGHGAGGIRVSVASGPTGSISFSGLRGAPPPAAGPPPLAATTGEDGAYELLVFGPGPSRVELAAPASGQGFPGRTVVVPDAFRFALDLEIAEATVSGVVVDLEGGGPLPDVSLRLSPAEERGSAGSGARSGPDGRFVIGAEPGDYVLSAERPGRVRVVRSLSVPPAGVEDLRLEIGRGLAITGRLLDATGGPAAGHAVFAIGADGFERAVTRADGSFRIEGLTDRPYALSAGSTLAGFATRPGVRPGPEPVALALRPAGRIELRVVSPDGRPVAEAFAALVVVDGEGVDPRLTAAPPTGPEGTTVLNVPAGEVGITVNSAAGGAFRSVVVKPGETVPLEVSLQAGPYGP
jgi:protocatechuate 3,4-dioxygenase beta subunit